MSAGGSRFMEGLGALLLGFAALGTPAWAQDRIDAGNWVVRAVGTRDIEPERLSHIARWLAENGYPSSMLRLYQSEVEVIQSGGRHWLPIQEQVLRAWYRDAPAGRRMRLELQAMGSADGVVPLLVIRDFNADPDQKTLEPPGVPRVSGWFELQPESRWSPSEAVLAAMKRDIQAAANASEAPGLAPDVSGYFVQYFGEGPARTGRITMFGSCELLRDDVVRDPRRVMLVTHDGGNCYFVAQYDLKRKAFTYFRFNGIA